MRVAFVGYPGYGREDPQGSLAKALEVPRIHYGDLVRRHIRQGTELGNRTRQILDAGTPLPDEILIAMVRDRFEWDTPTSFLLDGHPHSAGPG